MAQNVLGSNNIASAAVAIGLQSTNVRILDLSKNHIGSDAFVTAIALQNTNVQEVNFSHNFIDGETRQKILDLKLPIKFIF